MKTRRLLVVALGFGALAVCGVVFIRYRLELFVLPSRLREILRLEEQLQAVENQERSQEIEAEITRAATELIRLQRPDFAAGYR